MRYTFFLAGLLLCGALGCSDPIDLGNAAPTVTFESVTADGRVVEVLYTISDEDGDDVRVSVAHCSGGECSQMTAAPGGDGVANLPTYRHEPTLHLFRWQATCDIVATELERTFTIEIVPSDGESSGPRAVSAPLTLNELGVVGECPN